MRLPRVRNAPRAEGEDLKHRVIEKDIALEIQWKIWISGMGSEPLVSPRLWREIGHDSMHYREEVSHYANWLRQIPWQLFATLTFARRVGDAQAVQVFKAFVDRMEKYFRCPVVYVRGDERRLSGRRMPAIRRHFHALFAAPVALDPAFVRDSWIRMAGTRRNDGGADVRIYDPDRGALAYSLKQIFEIDGDWSFANLDLYLPSPRGHGDSRTRRRLARHSKRVLEAEHVVSLGLGNVAKERQRLTTIPDVRRVSSRRLPEDEVDDATAPSLGNSMRNGLRTQGPDSCPCLFCRHALLVS